MKRRLLAMFLTAAMALSITACGGDKGGSSIPAQSTEQSEESADLPAGEDTKAEEAEAEPEVDPMKKALENLESVTSMEAEMLMDMDLTLSANGEEESMETSTTMKMAMFEDPLKIKMEMVMDAGAQGTMEMDMYAEVAEDGTCMMYMNDGNAWTSQSVGVVDLDQYNAQNSMKNYIGEDTSIYKEEGKDTVNGASAYKYSYVMTGEEMKQTMLSSGALDSVSALGLDESQMESMLDGLGEITTYVWIDEATLYPVKYEMDMTEVMDKLMSNMIAAMGDQAAGMSMNVPKMTISMTCSNYNNVADFTIPEEAKTAE